MREVAVLSAPSNLGLMPPPYGSEPGVRYMAHALRQHGLVEALGAHDAGMATPPPYAAHREPDSQVRNGRAIRDYSLQLASAVGELLDEGYFPLLLGGDCSILLGPMLALRRRGNYGLLFVDGHRDFQTPQMSATGGAAGMDLALVTGRGPALLTRFDDFPALMSGEAAVALATRDAPEDDALLQEMVQAGITLLGLEAVRRLGPDAAGRSALHVLQSEGVEGFWIHLDVDVLDNAVMPAVDSPQDDGLSYGELQALLAPALASPLAQGMQVTIYDPQRDESGAAGEQLARFLIALLGGA